MAKRGKVIVPSQWGSSERIPDRFAAQAQDLSHLATTATLTIEPGRPVLFFPPHSRTGMLAVVTRVFPLDHEVTDHADPDHKVKWDGKMPLINLKGFRPFKPKHGQDPPEGGWPLVEEIIAGPVPWEGDCIRQAKAARFPETMVAQVSRYTVITKVDAQ